MFKVTAAGNTYQIEFQENSVLLDGEEISWDLKPIGDQTYHLISDNKSYLLQVSDVDPQQKIVKVTINGQRLSLNVQDRYDLLLEKLGMDLSAQEAANQVKAPMPGLILEVMVNEGEIVSQGDPVLVLEAMKMENILKSPREGTIRSIEVKQGQNVEKNQVLINFE